MTLLKDTKFKSKANIKWPQHLITPSEFISALRHRTRLGLVRSPVCSKLVLQFIGSLSYLLAHGLNRTKVFNIETFNEELRRIEWNQESRTDQPPHAATKRGPLITFSNHISCIDDPVLWASLLPLTYYSTHTDSVRWSAAAVDICFTKAWHSSFFSLGKTFPITRGAGIDQPAMDFALALLHHNEWLHLFPEGRVMRDDQQRTISNKDRGYIFKWGIAKLILDYFKTSDRDEITERRLRLLPFYHLGLDKILPIGWPYIPRAGKQITIFIRPKVIEMNIRSLDKILNSGTNIDGDACTSRSRDEINRIKLTRFLENEMGQLIETAEAMHMETIK